MTLADISNDSLLKSPGHLRVVDLKVELKRKNLPINGRKQDLVARLRAARTACSLEPTASSVSTASTALSEAVSEVDVPPSTPSPFSRADPFKRSTKTQRTPPPSLLRTPLADDAGKKVAQSYPSSADDAEPSSGAAETSVYKQSQFKANPQYHAQEVDPVTEANDQQSAPMRARRHSCGFHSMFLTCLGLVVLLGYGSVVLDTERWEHISEPVINTVISTLSESAANMVERGYSIHAYAWSVFMTAEWSRLDILMSKFWSAAHPWARIAELEAEVEALRASCRC